MRNFSQIFVKYQFFSITYFDISCKNGKKNLLPFFRSCKIVHDFILSITIYKHKKNGSIILHRYYTINC